MQMDLLQMDSSYVLPLPAPRKSRTSPASKVRLAAPPPAPPAPPPAPEDDAPEMMLDSVEKSPGAFRTISEAAKTIGVPQHVLRFWESRFSQIKPLKLRGGRRYYRPEDMEVLNKIKNLLYKQGYTIKGAKQAFSKEKPVSEPLVKAAAKKPIETQANIKIPVVSEKQKKQLAAILKELLAMREEISPYLAH